MEYLAGVIISPLPEQILFTNRINEVVAVTVNATDSYR